MKKKAVKEVKMDKLLVCTYKYQDFAQSQNFFVRSHGRQTVTFRNSAHDILGVSAFRLSCYIKVHLTM